MGAPSRCSAWSRDDGQGHGCSLVGSCGPSPAQRGPQQGEVGTGRSNLIHPRGRNVLGGSHIGLRETKGELRCWLPPSTITPNPCQRLSPPSMAAWEGRGDTEGPSRLASDVTLVGLGPEPPRCRCCLLPAPAAAACLPPLRAPPRGGRVSGPGCRGPQISFKFLPVEVGANPNQLMFAAPCEITAAGQG